MRAWWGDVPGRGGGEARWQEWSAEGETGNTAREVGGQDAPWSAHGVCFPVTTGFITMTPQLFINYKLKSVAHLPWRMLTYKALNTFIDDLFAFVIKMPVMYRIGCLRDGEAQRACAGGPAQAGRGAWSEGCRSPLSRCPPHPPRCGLLHLPLPTVDLPRRPHAGE